jgi:hypothetical protein
MLDLSGRFREIVPDGWVEAKVELAAEGPRLFRN